MSDSLKDAKIYIESLMRQWFEKMLPDYFLKIRYTKSKILADADYINRPARVITIRVSIPYLIANINNYRSDAFRKLVIHELAHIPDIRELKYAIRHELESPLKKKLMSTIKEMTAIEILLRSKQTKSKEQMLLKRYAELDTKYQRVMHLYTPYRERVKKYGGSESIADSFRERLEAYPGTKRSLVDPDIHNYLLVSCPKCHNIWIHKKDEKHVCTKCKVPLKARKLRPEEVIKFFKAQQFLMTKKDAMEYLRDTYPRF